MELSGNLFFGEFYTEWLLASRTLLWKFIKLPKNYFVKSIQVILTFHFVVFCWLFFRAKDFPTAFQIVDNIGNLTFDLEQWQTIILGYKNVFFLLPLVLFGIFFL